MLKPNAEAGMRTRISLKAATLVAAVLMALWHWSAEAGHTKLHEFREPPSDPKGLMFGSDGMFYGVGTGPQHGSLFRANPSSGEVARIAQFTGQNGESPETPPVEIGDAFYGTTPWGGNFGYGTIYKVDRVTGALTALVHSSWEFGAGLYGALIESGGMVFGTTCGHWGTIYRIDPATDTVTTIFEFEGSNGQCPAAALLEKDGLLYGTTASGGAYGHGTVFSFNPATQIVRPLAHFDGSNGANATGITQSGGLLYGVTREGGEFNRGVLFRLDPTGGRLETLCSFDDSTGSPSPALVQQDGNIFGTTANYTMTFPGGTLFRFDPATDSLSTLVEFPLNHSPAGLTSIPGQSAVFGTENVYLEEHPGFGGRIFRLDTITEELTTAVEFTSEDVFWPKAVVEVDGLVYGLASILFSSSGEDEIYRFDPATGERTTLAHLPGRARRLIVSESELIGSMGGISNPLQSSRPSRLFRVDPVTGDLTTVELAEGDMPVGSLLEVEDHIYGAASLGGSAGMGAIIEFDKSTNSITTVGSFPAGSKRPTAGLAEMDGLLYGPTEWLWNGGEPIPGDVFQFDPATGELTTAGSFEVGYSNTELIAYEGKLYGTMFGWGSFGKGAIFSLDPAAAAITLLASFNGANGEAPSAGLTESGGFLFGTTRVGGAHDRGTAFRFDPATNELTTLTDFDWTNGAYPQERLFESSPGVLYGTTSAGGTLGGGTLFRLSVLTPEFVITAPDWVIANSSANEASVPQIPGLSYSWTIQGGRLTGGQGTSSVTFDAGPAGSTIHLVLQASGEFATTVNRDITVDFADVPPWHPLRNWVNTIARNGITGGCAPGLYCPDDPVLRSQMAVFLLRAKQSSSYIPPAETGTMFADVPVGSFAAAWIEEMARRAITAGCAPNLYCPDASVTRGQMAVLLLKTLEGSAYQPPAAMGVFADVPVMHLFAPWIEELAARGITAGCQASPPMYCPGSLATRGQMAVFLTRTFALD